MFTAEFSFNICSLSNVGGFCFRLIFSYLLCFGHVRFLQVPQTAWFLHHLCLKKKLQKTAHIVQAALNL
jgi:hypothetical protein